jgi:hypothetical protein
MAVEIFRSALTVNDLVSSATTTTIAGQFVKLGERKIEAGELLSIGFGDESGQNNAQGRIYMKLRNATPADVEGTVRLQVYSPQNRPLVILGEWRTETLKAGDTDRTKQIPLPENMYSLSEDKKLVLEFMADVSGVVTKANSTIIFDTTTQTV